MIPMINFKQFYLFSVIFSASFIDTELVSLRDRSSVDETNWFASHYLPIGIFVLFVVAMSSVLVNLWLWITFITKQKKKDKMREDLFKQNGGNLLQRKLSRNINIELTVYTAQEMRSMTNSYSARNVDLGDCHPGVFFRGTLSEDDDDDSTVTEVAVVRIERVPRSQIKRFVEQLIFLSQPHRNLVRVRGCCLETESPLIVYELCGGGDGNATLFDCINYRDTDSCFPCEMRVKAAAGVARGLAYMNFQTFVHGNICTANILLDTCSYNAKIFYAAGSNLLISSEQEKCVYKDPQLKRLNEKSDVYSFGVVLAGLLRGVEIHDRSMALDLVLDEEMSSEGDSEVVTKVAALALKCLKEKPSERPFMKEVEATLSTLMQRIS